MAYSELSAMEKTVVRQAQGILDGFLRSSDVQLDRPDTVRDFLRLRLEWQHREVFTVLYLTNQNRLIEVQDLFFGTLAQTEVHPREIVRQGLRNNAAAVILAHNHPSGFSAPSSSDVKLTQRLREALTLFDIRLLDHLIVGQREITSLAETGQL